MALKLSFRTSQARQASVACPALHILISQAPQKSSAYFEPSVTFLDQSSPNPFHDHPQNNTVRSVTTVAHNAGADFSISLLSIAVRNNIINLGRNPLAYTSLSQYVFEGNLGRNSSRAGTWSQELRQRPWRGTLLTGLLSLLSYTNKDP